MTFTPSLSDLTHFAPECVYAICLQLGNYHIIILDLHCKTGLHNYMIIVAIYSKFATFFFD